ncbi:MAG: hypothetical protein ACRC33_00935 [Gemmataceae bacterium]
MSTATAPTNRQHSTDTEPELRIYSHSPVLYWWPVWAVGFLMALWTYLDGHHQLLVPELTVVEGNQIVLPPGGEVFVTGEHVARSRIPGVAFVLTLLAVSVLSHSYLRGPWSLFIGACVIAAVFLVGWLDWWGVLWQWVRLLSVHINLGGYLVISSVLFAFWAFSVFVFDRRTCLMVSTGQVRLRDELGDETKVFDSGSVTFEKRPSDWFRWAVGWGAGDLILRTGGPHPQVIEFPNVIGVNRWLHEVEQRLRTRDVI